MQRMVNAPQWLSLLLLLSASSRLSRLILAACRASRNIPQNTYLLYGLPVPLQHHRVCPKMLVIAGCVVLP